MSRMDQFIDEQEWAIWHNPAWSFEKKWQEQKAIKEMRASAMKIRWNAEQFNRRADFKRTHPQASPFDVDAMFPTSRWEKGSRA